MFSSMHVKNKTTLRQDIIYLFKQSSLLMLLPSGRLPHAIDKAQSYYIFIYIYIVFIYYIF